MSEPYYVWVCLECGEQGRGPGAHHVAGDDCCSNGTGHEKAVQPPLAKIPVAIADSGTRSHLFRARRRAAERLEEWQRKRGISKVTA